MTDDPPTELGDLLAGLSQPRKRISSKYHYDERGSRLFEKITELEEYYPTRTERALLEEWIPRLVSESAPRTLVELGAGSAEKSRIILDAMLSAAVEATYVPIDVSADFLAITAAALRDEYPGLTVAPVVADIMDRLRLDAGLPRPRWISFLGSTLGNFDQGEAVELLTHVVGALQEGDRFLLGVDLRPGLKKSAARIELAYNDEHGVTAAFSLNILNVLNQEFGSDFDLTGFRHRSIYDPVAGRIETSLVSVRDQQVRFPGHDPIQIEEGEAIRSEISCKYDRPTIDHLFRDAGLVVERWMEDEDGLYALVLGSLAGPTLPETGSAS